MAPPDSYLKPKIDPNRVGLLNVVWGRGGLNQPAPSRSLWKPNSFYILKVYNELIGKVKKYETSKTIFPLEELDVVLNYGVYSDRYNS